MSNQDPNSSSMPATIDHSQSNNTAISPPNVQKRIAIISYQKDTHREALVKKRYSKRKRKRRKTPRILSVTKEQNKEAIVEDTLKEKDWSTTEPTYESEQIDNKDQTDIINQLRSYDCASPDDEASKIKYDSSVSPPEEHPLQLSTVSPQKSIRKEPSEKDGFTVSMSARLIDVNTLLPLNDGPESEKDRVAREQWEKEEDEREALEREALAAQKLKEKEKREDHGDTCNEEDGNLGKSADLNGLQTTKDVSKSSESRTKAPVQILEVLKDSSNEQTSGAESSRHSQSAKEEVKQLMVESADDVAGQETVKLEQAEEGKKLEPAMKFETNKDLKKYEAVSKSEIEDDVTVMHNASSEADCDPSRNNLVEVEADEVVVQRKSGSGVLREMNRVEDRDPIVESTLGSDTHAVVDSKRLQVNEEDANSEKTSEVDDTAETKKNSTGTSLNGKVLEINETFEWAPQLECTCGKEKDLHDNEEVFTETKASQTAEPQIEIVVPLGDIDNSHVVAVKKEVERIERYSLLLTQNSLSLKSKQDKRSESVSDQSCNAEESESQSNIEDPLANAEDLKGCDVVDELIRFNRIVSLTQDVPDKNKDQIVLRDEKGNHVINQENELVVRVRSNFKEEVVQGRIVEESQRGSMISTVMPVMIVVVAGAALLYVLLTLSS